MLDEYLAMLGKNLGIKAPTQKKPGMEALKMRSEDAGLEAALASRNAQVMGPPAESPEDFSMTLAGNIGDRERGLLERMGTNQGVVGAGLVGPDSNDLFSTLHPQKMSQQEAIHYLDALNRRLEGRR